MRTISIISLCPPVGADDPVEEDVLNIRFPRVPTWVNQGLLMHLLNSINHAEVTTTEAADFYVNPINSVQEAADVKPETNTFDIRKAVTETSVNEASLLEAALCDISVLEAAILDATVFG